MVNMGIIRAQLPNLWDLPQNMGIWELYRGNGSEESDPVRPDILTMM